MRAGVVKRGGDVGRDHFGTLRQQRREPAFIGFFDDQHAQRSRGFGLPGFVLGRHERRRLFERNQMHHPRTAFLDVVGQRFFERRRDILQTARIRHRLAGPQHPRGERPHHPHQVRAFLHAVLPADGNNLRPRAFANREAHAVAAQELPAVVDRRARHFPRMQTAMNRGGELLEAVPEFQMVRGRGGFLPPVQIPCGERGHFLGELQILQPKFRRRIQRQKQFDHADGLLAKQNRHQQQHQFGGQGRLAGFAGHVNRRLPGFQHLHHEGHVGPLFVGGFLKADVFEGQIAHQARPGHADPTATPPRPPLRCSPPRGLKIVQRTGFPARWKPPSVRCRGRRLETRRPRVSPPVAAERRPVAAELQTEEQRRSCHQRALHPCRDKFL